MTLDGLKNHDRPRAINAGHLADKKHQFRLVLCGHKAVEAGAVCLVLMVQGHLVDVTLAHMLIATKTGALAVFPILGVTFTRHAWRFANRWTAATVLGLCTFLANAVIHESHYSGPYTEGAFTGLGAFAFSLAISYTPIGKRIDTSPARFCVNDTSPQRTRSLEVQGTSFREREHARSEIWQCPTNPLSCGLALGRAA